MSKSLCLKDKPKLCIYATLLSNVFSISVFFFVKFCELVYQFRIMSISYIRVCIT